MQRVFQNLPVLHRISAIPFRFLAVKSTCSPNDNPQKPSTTLNPNLEKALNKQLQIELSAAYNYMALRAYFESQKIGLQGFAKMQQLSIDEEQKHADDLMELIALRGGEVQLQTIEAPKTQTWANPLEALKHALKLEESNHKSTIELQSLAEEVKDYYISNEVQHSLGKDTNKSLFVLNKYIALLENDKSCTMLYLLDWQLQK